VWDDRGKYLFLTTEELDAVANWIQRRGRVNITELVAQSNKLIDLSGEQEEEQEQLELDEEDEQKA
jgi:hypothetical protein